MYSREYGGKTLNFEPSGGLMNASLVMQDKETDTYWSIMTGKAEAGELAGTELQEIPVAEKVRWAEWVQEYPETLVLSIDGIEHRLVDPYAQQGYWRSAEGFGGVRARDDRLDTKDPIYAFQGGDARYAVPHDGIEGGRSFTLEDGRHVFFHRPEGAELFDSTAAFVSEAGFEERDGGWVELGTGARFDPDEEEFVGGEVERLTGFDTFWYTWSLTHPETAVLR